MAEGSVGSSDEERKLFVGGLPQEASEEDVKEYFATFGEIENINLKTDPHTGRSRGFAFIIYKEASSIDAATKDPAHVVKGKKVTCKKAEVKQGKVFVGKLPEGVTDEEIKEHFSQFGPIVEVVRPIDKQNGDKPKNFAFITYEKEEIAFKLVKEGQTTLNGETVHIKKVIPKDQSMGGGRGGFGGGRGGFGGYGYGYGDQYGYGGYTDPYGGFGGYGGGYGGAGGGGYGGGGGGGYGGGFGGGWGGGPVRGGPGYGRGGGRAGSKPY